MKKILILLLCSMGTFAADSLVCKKRIYVPKKKQVSRKKARKAKASSNGESSSSSLALQITQNQMVGDALIEALTQDSPHAKLMSRSLTRHLWSVRNCDLLKQVAQKGLLDSAILGRELFNEGNSVQERLFLMELGANVKIQDKAGRTALMVASYAGEKKMVKALLDAGAEKNKQDERGWSSLHYSIVKGGVGVVKTLLAYNTDVSLLDNNGRAPLHYASNLYDLEIVRALLKSNASMDITDCDGLSPLEVAVFNDKRDFFKAFIRYGANLNRKQQDGATLLMRAILHSSKDIIQLLLDAGVHYSDQVAGKTALKFALEDGRTDIIQMLRDYLTQRIIDQNKCFKDESCLICFDKPERPTATGCCLNAVYCIDCIGLVIAGQNPVCPSCRAKLDMQMLLEVPELLGEESDESSDQALSKELLAYMQSPSGSSGSGV